MIIDKVVKKVPLQRRYVCKVPPFFGPKGRQDQGKPAAAAVAAADGRRQHQTHQDLVASRRERCL